MGGANNVVREEEVNHLLQNTICPVCQGPGRVTGSAVSCSGHCTYSVEWKGGVAGWGKAVEGRMDLHETGGCGARLGFASLGQEMMAVCEVCDYFGTVTQED